MFSQTSILFRTLDSLDYMKDKFSHLLCGFRKQFSTQHVLVRLTERWKRFLDKSGVIAGALMDLSEGV